MGTNWIVKVFELVLMAAFLIHILLGIVLYVQNKVAKGYGYKVASKSTTSFMSKYIIWTGLVIFAFLALHFYQFYFIKLGIVEAPAADCRELGLWPWASRIESGRGSKRIESPVEW